MLPTLLSLFLSTLLLLLTSPIATLGQLQTYTSAPSLSHTFDVEVITSQLPPNTSSFSWQKGLQPHEGMVLFNGRGDYLDLYHLPDDYGRLMPHNLSRSMSFEWWVKYESINTWSRMLDCGNGPRADNIIVSNVDATNDLRAAVFYGAEGPLSSIAYNTIKPFTWQHVVVTFRQKTRGDLESANSAEILIYVDGRLYSNNSNTRLPRQVSRQYCFIGISEWYLAGESLGDGFFSGWLDDFFYYDYPLSAEAVLAHYVLPRPPAYELTFSSDPRLIQAYPYNYTYSWTEVDPRDTQNITKYHNGFLNLTGDSYIDLVNRTGASSVGVSPPPIIGGVSGGNGTLDEGWSFEILFKPSSNERYAKLFDFGNGEYMDNIIIGYRGEEPVLQLEVMRDGNQTNLVVVPRVASNRWYHIIVVMRPLSQRQNGIPLYANVTAYVDGIRTAQTTATQNYPWPMPVRRIHSYIGRSNWVADEYFDALLDTFRIYDYALTPSEARDLYTVTHEELPRDSNSNQTMVYTYHTAPVTTFTFDARNNNNDMIEGTNFFWQAGETASPTQPWPHTGIAEFRGDTFPPGGKQGNYINLWAYPGTAPAFPRVVGGSMSFEVWAKWTQLARYSRILDIGSSGNANDHNIIIGQIGDTNGIMFEVYSGNVRSWLHVPNVNPVGEWVHIVASVEQISRADTWSPNSAILTMYINGVLVGRSFGFVPQRLARPSAYIARSNWRDDSYFNGQIDSFFFYDYALQAEQVAAHYLLPLPPVFELAFTKDPRPWVGDGTMALNQFGYQWHNFNASDFVNSNTSYHNGYLVFEEEEQYVDLTASTGRYSIGTTLPQVFGTSRGARLPQSGRWAGWSIEVLVKLTNPQTGAKIFSFSNGERMDEVGLGYEWDQTNNLVFMSHGGSDGQQPSNFACITDLKTNVWYHIIIVLSTRNAERYKADITCYVDGVAGNAGSGNDAVYMPRGVNRTISYLSRSVYRESTMDMHLDTFRIYDIAIDAYYAEKLYALTTSDVAQLVRPLYRSAPILSYTFDYDPATEAGNGEGTSYGWQATEADSGIHRGIATFDGRSNWINLLQWPDDRGVQFPVIMGGDSMAFEVWVKWDPQVLSDNRFFSRIFDTGNAAETDNILFGQEARGAELAFHVYRPNSTEPVSYLNTVTTGTNRAIRPDRWQHVVASIEDLSDWPCLNISENSATATYMTILVDGQLIAQRRGLLPRRVIRNFAYLGKSHWTADSLFQGKIDAFYFYDHALSTEQVNVRRIMPKPPVFDLSFSADPRWLLSNSGDISRYTYSWQEYDPTDSYANNTRSHSGHLVLTGSSNSYVNLSQPRGMSSIGTTLPVFGGQSDGVGVTHEERGWTFEMIVKLDTVAKWAKFIDLGQSADVAWNIDNVQFGYQDESRALEFRVYNALKGTAGSDSGHTEMNVVANVELGRWYHIIVTMRITSVSDFTAVWTAYVDGVQVGLPRENMYLPRAVPRPSQLIGASNWVNSNPPDSPFAAKIDALRLYDYHLSSLQASQLYRLAHEANAIPAPLVTPNEPVCASPPPVYPPSSTAQPPASRSSSSASTGPARSTAGPRFTTSSSSVKCPYWAPRYERSNKCVCLYAGNYPWCECPMPAGGWPSDDQVQYYPDCGDEYPDDGEYSSTGVAAAAGPPSGLIAGVVVALLFVAAVAGFVYFRYFRNVPKGSDDMALLGAPPAKFGTTSTNGSTNGNGSVRHSASTNDSEGGGGGEYHRHTDSSDKSNDTASHVELL